MSMTLAALDDSMAMAATARSARAVAALIGTEVVGIHVREPGSPDAAALSSRAGFPVEVEVGDTVSRLLAAFDAPDVVLAVMGSRDQADEDAPLGHVAMEVARATSTPLLVVPPQSPLGRDGTARRALLPLDGDPQTSAQVQALVQRLAATGVEIIATHVFDPAHVPRCLDDSAHSFEAWRREFLSRHGSGAQELHLRRGTAWEAVLDCADQIEADLIVLGWSQRLEPGRATVVTQALLHPTIPVLLLPEHAASVAA